MERLQETHAEAAPLSTEEMQAVLRRLRSEEEAEGTTVADLAEATGFSTARIAEALAAVRRESASRFESVDECRKRTRRRILGITAAIALLGAGALNAPLLGGPLATVTSVKSHALLDDKNEEVLGKKVEVEITVRPRTLWGRLFGEHVGRRDLPALFSPNGELQRISDLDGQKHGVIPDPFVPLGRGRYETSYEYPDTFDSRKATHLREKIHVGGEATDLNVPL